MQYAFVRLAAVIVTLLAFLPVVSSAPNALACGEVHPKTGDLNADGLTNSLDALAVLTFSAGMIVYPPDAAWMGGADVDCNGAVNAVDASLILQTDAGLTTIRP